MMSFQELIFSLIVFFIKFSGRSCFIVNKYRLLPTSFPASSFSGFIASVNEKVLSENAERIGRREQQLITKYRDISVMKTLPLLSCNKNLKDGSNFLEAILLRYLNDLNNIMPRTIILFFHSFLFLFDKGMVASRLKV